MNSLGDIPILWPIRWLTRDEMEEIYPTQYELPLEEEYVSDTDSEPLGD